MRRVRHCRGAVALSLAVLSGCATPPAPATPAASQATPYACFLPGEQRTLVAELFFGRRIRGHGQLSDAEWAEFAAQIVTPNFPDGFTVFDGDGQWRNPRTGHIARDPTKILLVAAKRTPDLARRLSAVIDAYKTRFHQQSVGVITRDSCAAF
ncbi:MAG TPA: DUF3574 domain-containing protein [Stellaceae bacterium]|nr:DUF3574 domain-containing protein [Stellaceae bacterium]